jgi:predicted transcriptional regulator
MASHSNESIPKQKSAKIIGIQFSILSPDEIRKGSVAEITSRDTYINNKPVTRGPKGRKTMGVETYLTSVYLESGLITLLGGEDALPLEIAVENPNKGTKSFKLLKVLGKDSDNNYTINEVKKCNLNFYTQRYINHNNLDISLDYQGEIQISKFRYDSIIYEALVKKVNQFFSRQLHKSVKHIKLFIQRVINTSSNKFMHEDIKKRLLYPIIYAVLSIIIKPEIPESKIVKYPNININNLSNIESKLLVNLEDFTKDDIAKYIITSYKLINNIDDSSSIESIPDILREHREYNDITGALDFTKVTELYYSLKEKYNGTKYLKIKIIDHIDSGITRSEVLKHKLCNNLIYNVFIQKQIFGVYKPNISSNSRFKYNIGFEILFTKSEQDNYEKLNSLYSLTKQKYYRDIKYPVTKNVKKGKVYKFKEKGMSKVRPFLYRFQTK